MFSPAKVQKGECKQPLALDPTALQETLPGPSGPQLDSCLQAYVGCVIPPRMTREVGCRLASADDRDLSAHCVCGHDGRVRRDGYQPRDPSKLNTNRRPEARFTTFRADASPGLPVEDAPNCPKAPEGWIDAF